MADFPLDDGVLADLRARASRNDWSGVRAMADHPALGGAVEAGLLVSEAELRQGDTVRAKIRLQWVIPEATRRHLDGVLRRATNMLGAAHLELGELPEAEAAFERVLGEATRTGDYLTAAKATNNLGQIANLQGRHDAALALYRVAAPGFQRVGYTLGLGETAHNIAITLRDLGQYDEAERHERRAIAYGMDVGNGRLAAMARAGRAEVNLRRGEPEIAGAEAKRAASEFATLPDPVSEADARRVAGLAELALGNLDQAGRLIGRALDLVTTHEAPLVEAETRRARAELSCHRGDMTLAEGDVIIATRIFEKLGAVQEVESLRRWWANASS